MMSTLVKVLYFGAAQEITGKSAEELYAGDTATLRRAILERYPAMSAVSYRIAVNRSLIREESVLSENDVVAILPPFQGG
jgi:molybdopterin converting factor small subunit